MKGLVIGAGEVGRVLYKVLSTYHETYLKDLEDLELSGIQVLHICFPYSENFINQVKDYQEKYSSYYVVIHSSVKPGTSHSFDFNCYYSPIRGRHSKGLEKELLNYDKFIFPFNETIARYFESCGIRINYIPFATTETLETLKLLSNIHMGLEIVWRQEVERILGKGTSEIYERWEQSYQNGQISSGDLRLIRPIMKPDPIGGHCILECTKLLKESIESKFFDLILEKNLLTKENSLTKLNTN